MFLRKGGTYAAKELNDKLMDKINVDMKYRLIRSWGIFKQ